MHLSENTLVGDVMTLDPIVISMDAPIEVAATLLSANHISGLPVVDEHGRLVGVISQSDLLAEGSGHLSGLIRGNGSGLRVGELMTLPAVSMPMTASLVEAARVMQSERIHRVVAIDDTGRPVGVLSATDYVALVADGGLRRAEV